MIWFCLIVRIVANPFSNVLQKLLTRETASPLFIIGVTHGLLSLACAPMLLFIPVPVSAGFWINLSICALLAVAANTLIVQALKLSDLSILGPINAWKPVVSLLPGLLLLHEFPGWLGASGIILIIVGSHLVMDRANGESMRGFWMRAFADKGIQCRIAALVLSAIEAVFLKRAILVSSPTATFAFWSILGFVVAAMTLAGRIGAGQIATPFVKVQGVPRGDTLPHDVAILRVSRFLYLMLAITTGLMQFCTIVTLEQLQVGYALALFQTSSLISVFLGHRVFDEPHFLRRLAGAAVMVAGAVLIILCKSMPARLVN
jgi:drug/metabolite transporter (DMT)-like permease